MLAPCQMPAQVCFAPAHHCIVVPCEQWPHERCKEVHPRPSGPHVPLVADQCSPRPVRHQAPASFARELAARNAVERTERLDPRCPHVKHQVVREPAPERVPTDTAQTIGVASLELLDVGYATPPLRPPR